MIESTSIRENHTPNGSVVCCIVQKSKSEGGSRRSGCVHLSLFHRLTKTNEFIAIVRQDDSCTSSKDHENKAKRTKHRLRMAHLLTKRSGFFMLTSPAWHHARTARCHTLLPAQQQRQILSAASVDLSDQLHRK